MKKIYIKTTESCQLRCKHCYIGDNRKYTELFDEDRTISWLQKYLSAFNIDEQDVLFSFHGGEPFLCPLHKMQKVVDHFPRALFDATSNLCFELTDKCLAFIKKNFSGPALPGRPFIKTSWDFDIRFPDTQMLKLWEDNVRVLLANGVDVKVIICLTTPLIEGLPPEDLAGYFTSLAISSIDFERLTENTTANKALLPAYDKQDKWLLAFYECNKAIQVGMFENLALACTGQFEGCRKRQCMQEVITINANGTVGGCPNSAIKHYFTDIAGELTAFEQSCMRNQLIKEEQLRNIGCYCCHLYTVCNGDCHQLAWQGTDCPAPKNLIRRIKLDVERQEKNGLSHA